MRACVVQHEIHSQNVCSVCTRREKWVALKTRRLFLNAKRACVRSDANKKSCACARTSLVNSDFGRNCLKLLALGICVRNVCARTPHVFVWHARCDNIAVEQQSIAREILSCSKNRFKYVRMFVRAKMAPKTVCPGRQQEIYANTSDRERSASTQRSLAQHAPPKPHPPMRTADPPPPPIVAASSSSCALCAK